nr:hypothetical protein [Tanacetum cinerariifolium]
MTPGNNHGNKPCLSSILHPAVIIHSNTFIRRDGNVQSVCCLKLTDICIADTASSMAKKRAANLKGKATADAPNVAPPKTGCKTTRAASIPKKITFDLKEKAIDPNNVATTKIGRTTTDLGEKKSKNRRKPAALASSGAFIDTDSEEGVDGTIVGSLIRILDANSAIAKAFWMARDWCHADTTANVKLRLLFERTRSKQYNSSIVVDVAALFTNDFGDGEPIRDIVVCKKDRVTQTPHALVKESFCPSVLQAVQEGPQSSRSRDKVFKLKLTELLDDLTKNHVFGATGAVVYVIEFQKRGLPYAHILLWLEEYYRCKEIIDIDDIISAELLSLTDDPAGYKAVSDSMLHEPCGRIIDPQHENVQQGQGMTDQKVTVVDEIKNYLNCRYLAPCEAVWQIFSFDIHHSYLSVMKLNFHLPNQQPVTLLDTDCLPALLQKEGINVAMFTDWFDLNERHLPKDPNVHQDSRTLCVA